MSDNSMSTEFELAGLAMLENQDRFGSALYAHANKLFREKDESKAAVIQSLRRVAGMIKTDQISFRDILTTSADKPEAALEKEWSFSSILLKMEIDRINDGYPKKRPEAMIDSPIETARQAAIVYAQEGFGPVDHRGFADQAQIDTGTSSYDLFLGDD